MAKETKSKRSKTRGRTPLMRQYYGIKDQHPHAILLFRMGDFYEAFEDDAHTISEILGITLTQRANGKAHDVPMAGFPHHSIDSHLPRLIRAGKRVAICEQVEEATSSKKVVDRDVVEIVTPGGSFHDDLLDPKRSNYLAAVHLTTDRADAPVGVSYIDVTTGEFSLAEIKYQQLRGFLETLAPSEILIEKKNKDRLPDLNPLEPTISTEQDWVFGYDYAYETLLDHFGTHSLKGFGVDSHKVGIRAAGAALHYLAHNQQSKLPHIRQISRHADEDYAALDPQTKRNLELVQSMRQEGSEGALIDILDETSTPMGGRRLRSWLVRPLKRKEEIEARLDAVETLFSQEDARRNLKDELSRMGDLERLAARIATGRALPRDIISAARALEQVPDIKQLLKGLDGDALSSIKNALTNGSVAVELIRSALVDDPPASIGDGGLIREGFNDQLDELRETAASGKQWVARLQKEEADRTNIPSLKVGFNKVFGYYLEITNTHKDKVPDEYIRKQTLVNSERYITPELKEYEEKILSAEEKIDRLEQQLFRQLREDLAEYTAEMQENAALIARLDCFASLAGTAESRDYVRPSIFSDRRLNISDGRHPVVEEMLPPGELFIPNDVKMDPDSDQIFLITGPNMAGKSVVLRQVGLIVLLAQVGSFVPAKAAEIGLVDRIFTRVGASDNLAAGESTFLVEMNETANILNNASRRSLILLDEVGRGTSTFDGLSIAWSLVEYLHEQEDVAARTLFATHYHELNELADRLKRVRNFRIQVQKHDGEVIFLRKLIPGSADHSYGVEVAEMAGLPDTVIARARQMLRHLESQHLALEEAGVDAGDGAPVKAASVQPETVPSWEESQSQMNLFQQQSDPALEELKQELMDINPDRITPIDALLKLHELKALLES